MTLITIKSVCSSRLLAEQSYEYWSCMYRFNGMEFNGSPTLQGVPTYDFARISKKTA